MSILFDGFDIITETVLLGDEVTAVCLKLQPFDSLALFSIFLITCPALISRMCIDRTTVTNALIAALSTSESAVVFRA